MHEAQKIDVERIMERIRENIKRRKGSEEDPQAEEHASPFADGQATVDFSHLHSGYDIRPSSFVSHRRMLGRLVGAVKQILVRLLAPILERQVTYNAANTRVATHMKDWVTTLSHHQVKMGHALGAHMEAIERAQAPLRDGQTALQERVAAFESQLRQGESQLRQELAATESRLREILAIQARLGDELAAQSQALHEARQAGAAARHRLAATESKLRRVLHDLETRQPGHRPPETQTGDEKPMIAELESGFDHVEFEERFRGTEEEIREHQRIYVPYFEGCDNVVDIGCGRGEFLELLRERGIKARGMDLDLDMILLCRDKGLDVVMGDAFAYLASLPDESVGGVFAAQVIEHLPPRRIIELVKLCHRKLSPGGVLILETPNPKCLMVFAESFYKDPTHIQPAHPDTMQFLFGATGFTEVELRFLAPVDPALAIPSLHAPGADVESFNGGIERLNALLFGFQDYAVIGRK